MFGSGYTISLSGMTCHLPSTPVGLRRNSTWHRGKKARLLIRLPLIYPPASGSWSRKTHHPSPPACSKLPLEPKTRRMLARYHEASNSTRLSVHTDFSFSLSVVISQNSHLSWGVWHPILLPGSLCSLYCDVLIHLFTLWKSTPPPSATNTTLEVFFTAPLKDIPVSLKEILYQPFMIHCNVVLMSPSCSSPPLHPPPLGETGKINMAAMPSPVWDGWTLGFGLELQRGAQIDPAASHTCLSTQLFVPLPARFSTNARAVEDFPPLTDGTPE